jgi:hypothetical protein
LTNDVPKDLSLTTFSSDLTIERVSRENFGGFLRISYDVQATISLLTGEKPAPSSLKFRKSPDNLGGFIYTIPEEGRM